MAKLLLNADGKVLTSNDKVLKAPESTLKKLLDAKKSAYNLFYGYQGTSIDDLISYNDTENVTNMYGMCDGCDNLITFPQLNTGKVTNMYLMCQDCKNLIYIKLDTINTTNLQNTFAYCSKLQTIDLSSLDKVTNISRFADSCYSLNKFIVREMTKLPILSTDSFKNCHHFTGTVHSKYNPEGLKDGRIYIPDDFVEQLKQATNWSVYADIIVPLSTLGE